MPFAYPHEFKAAIPTFAKYVTQYLTLQQLDFAIDKTHYCLQPTLDPEHATWVDVVLLFTVVYPMFRAAKLYSRSAWQQKITEENFRQVLVDILNDEGGNGRDSFKWALLRQLGRGMAFDSRAAPGSMLEDQNIQTRTMYYHFVTTPPELYTDDDVLIIINKIKAELISPSEKPVIEQMSVDDQQKKDTNTNKRSTTSSTTTNNTIASIAPTKTFIASNQPLSQELTDVPSRDSITLCDPVISSKNKSYSNL